MPDIFAHPMVVATLTRMEHLEERAYAVLSQNLSARAKLARIRLLRKEAEAEFGDMKRKLRNS